MQEVKQEIKKAFRKALRAKMPFDQYIQSDLLSKDRICYLLNEKGDIIDVKRLANVEV